MSNKEYELTDIGVVRPNPAITHEGRPLRLSEVVNHLNELSSRPNPDVSSELSITTNKHNMSAADTVITRTGMQGGACSFCDRGELTTGGAGLKYPYKKVTTIRGVGIGVRACDECLDAIYVLARGLKDGEADE